VLETIGYDPRMDRWATAADATIGRVTSVTQGIASVLTDTGPHRAGFGGGLLGRIAADPGEAPCAGDWCVLRTWPGHRLSVERLLPRSTVIAGRPPGGVGPLLCANADLVAVVVAARSRHTAEAVDEMVGQVTAGGARPLVVVITPDLAPDDQSDHHSDEESSAQQIASRLAGGVAVSTVCAGTGLGVPALREHLEGRLTMALTGPAGQGRRALVEALVGVGTMRRRGLVPLPSGGAVIDTPDLTCEPAPLTPTAVFRTGVPW